MAEKALKITVMGYAYPHNCEGSSKAIHDIAVIFIAMLIFISKHYATKLSTLKS